MNLTDLIPARELTDDDIEAYLHVNADPEVRKAANAALAALNLLCHRLQPSDLVRMVALVPAGLKTLEALVNEAHSVCAAVSTQRKLANALMAADSETRHALDSAVIQRLGDAKTEAETREAQAAAAMRDTAGFRARMIADGMLADEVDRLVAARVAGERPDGKAFLAAAAAARGREAQLARYLRDPLRRRDALDADVLEGLLGLNAVRSTAQADVAAMARQTNLHAMRSKRLSTLA